MIHNALALGLLFACNAALAEPVKYIIDSSHTYPSFEADHTGLSVWRGKVNSTKGTVILDREAKTGSVDIVMDMATIDFGHEAMNKHARAEDMLDVARYPTATYTGDINFTGDTPAEIVGNLTLHGITKPTKVQIKSFGCRISKMLKKEVCGADAAAVINRDEFGVDIGREFGSRMDVKLLIAIEAIIAGPPAPASS